MEKDQRPPGLRFDGGRPIWRASKQAVKKGYPVKSVNLAMYAGDPGAIRDRCAKLQREMLEWMTDGGNRMKPRFDGTFRSLFDVYTGEPKSSYFALKRASRHPYDVYLKMLRNEIGHCHIDKTNGLDLAEWFDFWATPAAPGGPPMIAKARTAIAVIKAAIAFGVLCRFPGCPEFRAILSASKFTGLKPRTAVVTADEVVAARLAAHAAGHPGAALAYAIQFEGTVRQWDVVGQWVPIADPQPSAVLNERGEKWIGPTWANVDANLILRYRPSKTETTTGEEVVVDFRACPMILEEIEKAPPAARNGPLIVNVATGLPYRQRTYQELWRVVAKASGIPAGVWNRDLRASGSTEARAANATTDDVQKLLGHARGSETTARVYDRAKLEAHRRIAEARKLHRGKPSA